MFYYSADSGTTLPPMEAAFNPWSVWTYVYPLESAETAAFFSLWAAHSPLTHYTNYNGEKITKKNKKKIEEEMKKKINMK